MHRFAIAAALAAALTSGASAIAREKPDQPKARKVCRTVQMSGRITPQRVCRPKAERPDDEDSSKPAAARADETTERRD
jgi:hypothetical protein